MITGVSFTNGSDALSPTPSSVPPRILVVDDDATILKLARQVLEGAGFAVEVASSGADATEKLLARMPDIVLLDIMMPGVDGPSVKEILVEHRNGKVPLVVFSAVVEKQAAEFAQSVGAAAYLTKPFDIDELVAMVKRALANAQDSAPGR